MHQPLRHTQPCVPCGRRLSTLLKAKSGREGRRWRPLCQLEEKLDQVARSINQVAGVFHFVVERESLPARPPPPARPPAAPRCATPARAAVSHRSQRGRTERECVRERAGERACTPGALSLSHSALSRSNQDPSAPLPHAPHAHRRTQRQSQTHTRIETLTRDTYIRLYVFCIKGAGPSSMDNASTCRGSHATTLASPVLTAATTTTAARQ